VIKEPLLLKYLTVP